MSIRLPALLAAAIISCTLFPTATSAQSYSAIKDFEANGAGDYVPSYADKARKSLAINAAKFKDAFASATCKFQGSTGTYDLILTTLTETDGESTYRVSVNDKRIGDAQNPATDQDYQPAKHRFESVKLKTGDTIRVDFNSASNGRIPEGDSYAFARGRWQSLEVVQARPAKRSIIAQEVVTTSPKVISVLAKEVQDEVSDVPYDPANAKIVHRQKDDGTIVVEAESYDGVAKQIHRTWYKTTIALTPDVTPDPDPNHAEGASGGAYLELLPDTRVTHADPLVKGVSFTNQPGERSVLFYPIEFKQAGRYYVWVRMCCTGSEDNGIHVGLDGAWPASGARMQFTGKHGQWQWDSRQRTEKVHTGVLGQIWLDVDQPGLHTVMFSMREDGFEFDKFLLTREEKALPSKSTEMGPMP